MRKKRYFIGIDLSKYRGKYVAIIDKKVVASGTDAKEVWADVKRRYPDKTPELAKISREETLVLAQCK
jgi:lysine/ornithine N-monooxygenase